MSQETKYLLDANVLIEAHRRYYAFDIVPSFWQKLIQLATENKIISIDRIKDEILKGHKNDMLTKWAKSMFNSWFKSTDDPEVFKSYSRVIGWVNDQQYYKDYAKTEFASVADSWLIAYALTYNHTIITHEIFDPNNKKKVLIPVVCEEFNIPYMNTFDMLRSLNTQIG